ncbi:MAG: IPT/TIG domain-containing protein [Bryobacteraceae bacterium]
MRGFPTLFAAVLSALPITGQTVSSVFIESVAGVTVFDNRPPRETPLIQPQSVWVHPSGDLYIADGNFYIRRVRGNVATIVAGGGTVVDDSVPVSATRAKLDYPGALAGTPAGEIYLSDVRHHRVRKLSPDGTITTVAGRGTPGYTGDGGPGIFAELNTPTALALRGDDLFIADTGNQVIRKLNIGSGVLTTVAGTGEAGSEGDGGPALDATLGVIRGLAVDAAGNLYLADTQNYVVRRISTAGIISTYAGNGDNASSGDGGPATAASIGASFGLAMDSAGNLYIAETGNSRVRRVSSSGIITTYAGPGASRLQGVDDVPAIASFLHGPGGIALDATGNLYVPETDSNLIRRVDAATGVVTTVAGTLNPFDHTAGISAPLIRPTDVAADARGNVYVADNGHYRVRRIDRLSGLITTVAGNGREGQPGQGQGQEAQATTVALGGELSISIDPLGRLLIADRAVRVVRRVDLATGKMVTLVDFSSRSGRPAAAAGDALGNVYISDWFNDQIFRWSSGVLSPIAGTGRTGFSGDGGPALEAELNSPEGITLDGRGGLLVCDFQNHVVRRIDLATGTITRFAGDGLNGYDYDGRQAVEASLSGPVAATVDAAGNVYIADSGVHVVRVVAPSGIISTFAGSGSPGFGGDGGPALLAKFDGPLGISAFGSDIYVCDSTNYRIRRLFRRSVENSLLVEPRRFSFRAVENGELPTDQLMVLRSAALGLRTTWSLGGGTDSGGVWLYATELEGATPAANFISVDPTGLPPGTYTGAIIVSSPGLADQRVPVDLEIAPATGERRVQLAPNLLQFPLSREAQAVQQLSVASSGRAALAWSIRRVNSSPWLSFGAESGITPSNLTVRAASEGLEPGTYTALVNLVVEDGATSLLIVTMTVSEPQAVLQVDRKSVVFRVVEGSTNLAAAPVFIFNHGSAPLNWEIVLPSGGPWLRVSPAGGTIKPGAPPSELSVTANAAGLRAGDYAASLRIRSPEAAGSPFDVPVRLRVFQSGTPAQPVFSPAALVFVAGGSTPGEQSIELSSTGGEPLSYTTSIRTSAGGQWLNVTPATGTVLSSSDKAVLRVQVRIGDLTEETYSGAISFSFSDGTVREISVLLINPARSAAARTPQSARQRHAVDGCAPGRQLIVAPTLPNNFAAVVGWPVPLQARVLDNCGAPSASSTVNVSFSNGDPPMVLANLRNGRYTGTWTPAGNVSSVTISMQAIHPSLASQDLRLSGRLSRENSPPPVLFPGGVVNAASLRKASIISPGGLVLLSGANFQPGATAVIGGIEVGPVSVAEDGIRLQVPAQLAGQRNVSVAVVSGGYATAAESVDLVPFDPGLFPLPDGLEPRPSEVLLVKATGLGPLNEEGGLRTPVTAKLGEVEIPVESVVAAPDAPGVFDIAVRIPAEASGLQALVILQNEAVSNALTVNLP